MFQRLPVTSGTFQERGATLRNVPIGNLFATGNSEEIKFKI
jgi:hypothetical protein